MGGRGNADWQSAQYKESNGGKNATEQNNKDGEAVQTNRHTMPDNKRNRRRREDSGVMKESGKMGILQSRVYKETFGVEKVSEFLAGMKKK